MSSKDSEKIKIRDEDKQIIAEIVRHLVQNDNYIVYGYWLCRKWNCKHKQRCYIRKQCERIYFKCLHEPQCQIKSQCESKNKCQHEPQCQDGSQCRKKRESQWQIQWHRENSCQHECQIQFTREFLDDFLKSPEKLYDHFINKCDKCNKENLIMSFLLYTPKNSNRIPTIEVIRHLEWNNLYRVFGNWKCLHCKKKWPSAYTWISLEKFIAQTPGNHLSSGDSYMQQCKTCKAGDNNIIISSYKALEQSDDGTIHKRLLCAKCLAGAICVQTDTYLGKS